MEDKVETPDTISFSQFDWVETKYGAIQLTLFDEEMYSATLILWVNKEEFPLILETNIYCHNEECVILQAYETLQNLCNAVCTNICVFDENGDELDDLDLDDYIESEGESNEE